jgi:nucleoside-diphosphate kinase
MERTLVLVKPDGVQKAVIGAVIGRFEDAGYNVIALKMLKATKEQVGSHYAADKEWLLSVGKKTRASFEAKGVKMDETDLQIGERIRGWLLDYLTEGPIVAMVVEGNDVIAGIRKIAGSTSPDMADPASIRGMYSKDSYAEADKEHRPVRNILHASDGETAKHEIEVWFTDQELYEYKRIPRTG